MVYGRQIYQLPKTNIHGNLRTVSNGEDTASLLQVGSGGGAEDPLLKDGGDLAQGSLAEDYHKLHIVDKDSIIVNNQLNDNKR